MKENSVRILLLGCWITIVFLAIQNTKNVTYHTLLKDFSPYARYILCDEIKGDICPTYTQFVSSPIMILVWFIITIILCVIWIEIKNFSIKALVFALIGTFAIMILIVVTVKAQVVKQNMCIDVVNTVSNVITRMMMDMQAVQQTVKNTFGKEFEIISYLWVIKSWQHFYVNILIGVILIAVNKTRSTILIFLAILLITLALTSLFITDIQAKIGDMGWLDAATTESKTAFSILIGALIVFGILIAFSFFFSVLLGILIIVVALRLSYLISLERCIALLFSIGLGLYNCLSFYYFVGIVTFIATVLFFQVVHFLFPVANPEWILLLYLILQLIDAVWESISTETEDHRKQE